jgi:hypothetical protein
MTVSRRLSTHKLTHSLSPLTQDDALSHAPLEQMMVKMMMTTFVEKEATHSNEKVSLFLVVAGSIRTHNERKTSYENRIKVRFSFFLLISFTSLF